MNRTISNDLLLIAYHIRQNISWREGGSFTKEDKNGNWVFDKRTADRAEKALYRIAKALSN